MSDIVERLESTCVDHPIYGETTSLRLDYKMAKEAAAEITRLRAELASAKKTALEAQEMAKEILSNAHAAENEWKEFPAPRFERVFLAGVQPRRGFTSAYWWIEEGVTDENGMPFERPEAIRWCRIPKPPQEDCEAAAIRARMEAKQPSGDKTIFHHPV